MSKWAIDPKAITQCFNTKSETAFEKPMFRAALKSSRCLVLANVFFEWAQLAGIPKKVKYRISRADGDLCALAGLWEYWSRDDEEIVSYTVLTCGPNMMIKSLHNRMPVILGEEAWNEWLDPATSIDTSRLMCMPCPSEWLTAVATA